MNKKFILWEGRHEIRANCREYINELPTDVTWDVTIAKHVNSKSKEQRGWFHKLCAILREEIGIQEGDVKEIAKAKLFGWKQVEYGGVTLTLSDGHSETLNADKYGELIETVYMLAGESGIVLPEADKWR